MTCTNCGSENIAYRGGLWNGQNWHASHCFDCGDNLMSGVHLIDEEDARNFSCRLPNRNFSPDWLSQLSAVADRYYGPLPAGSNIMISHDRVSFYDWNTRCWQKVKPEPVPLDERYADFTKRLAGAIERKERKG